MFAMSMDFQSRWVRANNWDAAFMLLLWVVACLERFRGSGAAHALFDGTLDFWAALHILAFAWASLILLALVCCMMYICRALMNIVDAYCLVIVSENTLEDAVPRWNLVQATLRHVSARLQACLFILHATVTLSAILGVFDVYKLRQEENGYVSLVIPVALLEIGIFNAFVRAALVTDKCARVPSLINSCNFGEDIDEERTYVVDYVLKSAAGFYVFEIRLTSEMTMKFAYLCAVGVFALSTQMISDE